MRSLLLLAVFAAPSLCRHSLHWGPSSPGVFLADNLPPVDSRLAGSLIGRSDARARGRAIANDLIRSIVGDQLDYRFESGAVNEASGVYSSHWYQRFNGRDVANAMFNVNVDIQTDQVISYGNSFHDYRCRDAGSASTAGQIILGGERAGRQMACVDPQSQAQSENPVDPRLALISFLLPVRSAEGVFAVAPDAHADELFESMRIEHPLTRSSAAENRVLLHNAPGSIKATQAKLVYMAHDDSLKLAWEFVYESNDNLYNSFVSADATSGLATLAVTDWIRDFAPSDIPEWPAPVPPKKPSKKIPAPDKPTPKPPAEPVDPSKAQYKVFGWGCNDPSECDRRVIVNPADKAASPFGWHHIPATDKTSRARSEDWDNQAGWTSKLGGGLNSSDTRGNNVFAQENWSGGASYELNYRPVHANLSFEDKLHWHAKNFTDHAVDPHSYIAVAVTELFYIINELHDLTLRYGFDEENGNFQQVNHLTGKGKGGDPVIAMAQDGSGVNNANMATPPDGQPGRMRMYIWTTGDQQFHRDGDLEAGIVTHEYMHGVSTRLTGPPSQSSCLGWAEAGGMGEGWGDFTATLIRHHGRNPHDWPMGKWAYGNEAGIRHYPYSLNMTVNPSTYAYLNKPGYFGVHAIGEVWSTMLFSVLEAFIAKHGYSKTLFPPVMTHDARIDAANEASFYNVSLHTGRKHPGHGNTYTLQIVLDAMKLQPCRPTFANARDAIIQADKVLSGGENTCLIWHAFASRGLGPKANVQGQTPWGGGIHTEDFGVPSRCSKTHQ